MVEQLSLLAPSADRCETWFRALDLLDRPVADVPDYGPGSRRLRDHVVGWLAEWSPKRRPRVYLIVQDFDTGERTEPVLYTREDLTTLTLPTNPRHGRDLMRMNAERLGSQGIDPDGLSKAQVLGAYAYGELSIRRKDHE